MWAFVYDLLKIYVFMSREPFMEKKRVVAHNLDML